MLAWGLVALVAALGLLDILPADPRQERQANVAEFKAHQRFAAAIQEAMPQGATIHQLPARPVPLRRLHADGAVPLHQGAALDHPRR